MRRITQHIRTVPQSEALVGRGQVVNDAGGYVWGVGPFGELERFLILGTSAPTYYASSRTLTRAAAAAVTACLAVDGVRVVDHVVAVSEAGRAPSNDPALFALAMALKLGDVATRRHARAALPRVARTLAHLYRFAEAVDALGGWGRGTRAAFATWLTGDVERLAYQAIKYRQREGWTLRDLLRKVHARPVSAAHDELFAWVTGKEPVQHEALAQVAAFEAAAKATSAEELVKLVLAHDLPREAVPTRFLGEAVVWEALLQRMPMTALLRSLGKLSAVGLLTQGSATTKLVVDRLRSREQLRRARIHPLSLLVAGQVFGAGKGVRGSMTWRAVPKVKKALQQAFQLSFQTIRPTGRRFLLALDVSGSMSFSTIAGLTGITPRVGSAAMAMATLRTEPAAMTMGFSHKLVPLALSPSDSLKQVLHEVDRLPMGGTDCALPMVWARKHKVEVDCFVVYTDNETWFGGIHPSVALERYRQAMGRDAKLVVVGMVANQFTIADPGDPGMLDVVGFDTAAPRIMADFAR